jgi:LuxR family transcriptional regulator
MEAVIIRKGSVTLTERQVKIVEHLARGLRTKEIAAKLKISSRTTESHIDILRAKVDAKSQAHLVAIFIREGLIK